MIGNLSTQETEEVLKDSILGRIGCNDDRKNYVVPISYVYDGEYVMAHSAEGMKIEMMRRDPNICFQVDAIDDYNNWKCVIAWGKFEEVKDELERNKIMKVFVDRMLHLKISETAIPPEMQENRMHQFHKNIKPVIYRIKLLEKTGRFEKR